MPEMALAALVVTDWRAGMVRTGVSLPSNATPTVAVPVWSPVMRALVLPLSPTETVMVSSPEVVAVAV